MINWQLSNRVSADQYHLTVLRAQVRQVTSFEMIAGSSLFFQKFIWNMLCLCHYGPALLIFWFQTDLGRKNSVSYLKIQAGETFSYHSLTLVTLYVQFLCSDWSKFDMRVHATAEADRVLCHLVMFLTAFFHWMYKMKYSCYQEFSIIHGWFVYWVFGWEMRRSSKSEIRFRMASFSFFMLLDA